MVSVFILWLRSCRCISVSPSTASAWFLQAGSRVRYFYPCAVSAAIPAVTYVKYYVGYVYGVNYSQEIPKGAMYCYSWHIIMIIQKSSLLFCFTCTFKTENKEILKGRFNVITFVVGVNESASGCAQEEERPGIRIRVLIIHKVGGKSFVLVSLTLLYRTFIQLDNHTT